jgi:hypothetical protein
VRFVETLEQRLLARIGTEQPPRCRERARGNVERGDETVVRASPSRRTTAWRSTLRPAPCLLLKVDNVLLERSGSALPRPRTRSLNGVVDCVCDVLSIRAGESSVTNEITEPAISNARGAEPDVTDLRRNADLPVPECSMVELLPADQAFDLR